MRHVGDEVPPRLFHPLGFRQIAQHRDHAAVRERRRRHIERSPRHNRCRARRLHFLDGGRRIHRGQEVRIANRLHHRRIQPGMMRRQPVHLMICPAHHPIGAYRDHRVLHAVEKRLELALAGPHRREAAFHLLRRLVNRRRHPSNLIQGGLIHPRVQIPSFNSRRHIHDPLQPARGPDRSPCRDQQGNKRRQRRAPKQPSPHLRFDRFHVRQGIGQPHRPARDRSGDIKKRYPQRGAASFVLARLSR